MSTLNPARPSGIMRLYQLGHDYPSQREGGSRSSHASGDLKGLTLRGGCTMSTFNPTHPLAIMRLHLLGHKYPYIKKGGGRERGRGREPLGRAMYQGASYFVTSLFFYFLVTISISYYFSMSTFPQNLLSFFHIHFSRNLLSLSISIFSNS